MSDQKTTELTFNDVVRAHNRIRDHIEYTGIISNKKLDEELGAKVFFKMEDVQKTKSFKARGAFSAILAYQELHGKLPEKIVAQSSGNHAQGVAYAGKILDIPVLIYMANNVSLFKIAATKILGAKIVLCEKRSEANRLAEEKQKEGYFFIHPSDNDDVIAGQGTATLEALNEIDEVDAIFAPCGGGGLVVGCYLASLNQTKIPKVFGCEPLKANDAAISLREGKIFSFEDSPETVADGAKTLSISSRCFEYLKKTAGILEIPEEQIIYWRERVREVLNHKIELTSALAVAGVAQYMKKNPQLENQKFLVIISGGNFSGYVF